MESYGKSHEMHGPLLLAASPPLSRRAGGPRVFPAVAHGPAVWLRLPDVAGDSLSADVVDVDLNKPMADIRKQLSQFPVSTRLNLSGTIVVARDIAHAKIQERINAGEGVPQYLKDHIVYYAGPAKTPDGMASGSFGPTTAGRMDSYVGPFMAEGGSFITINTLKNPILAISQK